jgi:hypothetical protein
MTGGKKEVSKLNRHAAQLDREDERENNKYGEKMCRQAKSTCNQFKLLINVIDQGRIIDGTWLAMIMILYGNLSRLRAAGAPRSPVSESQWVFSSR